MGSAAARAALSLRRVAPLLFAAGVAGLGCNARPAGPPKGAGPPKVAAAPPLVRSVTEFTDLTGTLAAVKAADVRARVSGYVRAVPFHEGAEVKAGDTLVQIDPEPFELAVGQAQTAVKSATAQREQAAATETRLAKGLGSGVVSQEEYDQAKAQVLVTRAGVEKAQKDVEQAQLNLRYATVVAPFDGRVDRVFVNEGNLVTGGTGQGTVLTRVVTVDPTYAYFTVDEHTVLEYLRRTAREGRVTTGQGGGVPVEIQLRDETGYPHKGTIEFAGSELNPSTGTLQIRGTFPNPGPPRLLRPGLFVRGRIPGATVPDAVLIPDEAVVSDQAQRVVYVVGPNNRVAAKPVRLGPLSLGLRVVEGLAPTDRVVITGLARLQPEMEIDPQPGEITPVADKSTAAGPGGWGTPGGPGAVPTGPNGNPGQGAQPGTGGNAAPGGGARGRPATVADPQGRGP
ncbi:efflux RND transporter periplasmic adaptor subunit [Gemmata sp.]|uniref:efflux RND transporter periplasmic adaptor subunit n=1 Tax=Gemmata sp. TaxID=1914242 RepID=UPI003F6FE885